MDRAEFDRLVLDLIQEDFPAAARPYAELARRLRASLPPAGAGEGVVPAEERLYAAVTRLRDSGIIRRLGGVFDSRALGFRTTLAAASVPADRLEAVAAAVSAYPEVTHNYAREGPLNLWFTVVAPDQRRIDAILAALHRETGLVFRDLPAHRVYKTEVRFRFGSAGREETGGRDEPSRGDEPGRREPGGVREAAGNGRPSARPEAAPRVDETDRRVIRALQGDLPRGLEPYAAVGRTLGLERDEILARIARYREEGWLKRVAAVLAHVRAGIAANAMVAWEVPDEAIDAAGRTLAAAAAVTHCYARPPLPDWPYRLYSMVHARTRQECMETVAAVARDAGLGSYQVLFSTREFKKTSPAYF